MGLNLKGQLSKAFVVSLLMAVGFGLVALWISDKKILRFDSTIISFVQGWESSPLTAVMKFFSFIGSAPVVIVLAVLIMLFLFLVLKHRLELILFVTVVLGADILNRILKNLFHRARPTIHPIVTEKGFSFPSGHSMEAFAFYGVLAFLLWRHIPTRTGRGLLLLFSGIMILAIGISRIYLGVHYPSDVVGGYLASGFWLGAAIWYYQRYMEKRN